MAHPVHEDGVSKLRRYRRRQRLQGMKQIRLWVTDPTASGFVVEAERQARLLRGAPEEAEALDFIEAIFDSRES